VWCASVQYTVCLWCLVAQQCLPQLLRVECDACSAHFLQRLNEYTERYDTSYAQLWTADAFSRSMSTD